MDRRLAKVLLALLIIGLLFSMYAFSRGRIYEGLYIYPLLIAIYVLIKIGSRGKK